MPGKIWSYIMGIRIITDSTTEFTQEEAKKLNIEIVPLKSLFGNEVYLDGIDLSPAEFYEKLEAADKLPTTSQPAPHEFEQVFREAQANGDQIIAICIASVLSGTWQSACIAKENCGGDIWVIDSEVATITLQILVRLAISLRDSGKTAEEIVSIIEKEKKTLCLLAAIDTLEYLNKGGRLSKAQTIMGGMLNIKPIVTLDEGHIKVMGKCRGIKNAYKKIFDYVNDVGGIDYSKPFAIGYTGNRDRFNDFEEVCKNHLGKHKPIIGSIGSVVGTHAGPGAVAITFFKSDSSI